MRVNCRFSFEYIGNQTVDTLPEEKESNTRDDLQPIPILTTPQSKSLSPFSCHRAWSMGTGKGVRRERGGGYTGKRVSMYN